MNIDPGYVPYDPYVPHTIEEIREYNKQREKINRENNIKNHIRSTCNRIENIRTIKYHTAGQRLNDPPRLYKEIKYIDKDGNILLEETENIK